VAEVVLGRRATHVGLGLVVGRKAFVAPLIEAHPRHLIVATLYQPVARGIVESPIVVLLDLVGFEADAVRELKGGPGARPGRQVVFGVPAVADSVTLVEKLVWMKGAIVVECFGVGAHAVIAVAITHARDEERDADPRDVAEGEPAVGRVFTAVGLEVAAVERVGALGVDHVGHRLQVGGKGPRNGRREAARAFEQEEGAEHLAIGAHRVADARGAQGPEGVGAVRVGATGREDAPGVGGAVPRTVGIGIHDGPAAAVGRSLERPRRRHGKIREGGMLGGAQDVALHHDGLRELHHHAPGACAAVEPRAVEPVLGALLVEGLVGVGGGARQQVVEGALLAKEAPLADHHVGRAGGLVERHDEAEFAVITTPWPPPKTAPTTPTRPLTATPPPGGAPRKWGARRSGSPFLPRRSSPSFPTL